MISRKFIKSSLIYTIAGALPMASAIILLPFYIDQLSIDQYSELAIDLAFSLLVQVLVTYSFDSSLYIHYHEFKHDRKKLSVFVSSSFVFMLLIGLGVGLILTVTGDFLFSLVLKDSASAFFPFGFAAIGIGIFQALFRVYSNLNQTQEKPEVYLVTNILMFSLIALFTVVGLFIFPSSLIGPVHGRLLASAIVGGIALYKIFREFGFNFDFQWLRKSFNFNAVQRNANGHNPANRLIQPVRKGTIRPRCRGPLGFRAVISVGASKSVRRSSRGRCRSHPVRHR